MALSANAIGFYLEAEDVSLSKTLKKATSNYENYVKALEGYNERAFKSAQSGLGQVSDLLSKVRDLPAAVEKSMKSASSKLSKTLKPIAQKVDLQVTVKSANKLKKLFGQAVSDAMSGARIRMTATMPDKRMAMFQRGIGLRAQYRDVVQPPDMKGKLSPLKKFAKGGVVEGPAGIDKVLALLTKDEMVLPADVSKELQDAAGGRLRTAGGKFASVKELGNLVAEVTNLAAALDKMKGGLEAGVGDKNTQKLYVKGVKELERKVGMLAETQDDLSFVTKVRVGPAILQVTERMEELREAGVKTGTRMEKLFGKIIGPARFLALAKGIEAVQEGFNTLRSGASSAFTTLGGEAIGSGIDSMNELQTVLSLSREELVQWKIRAGQAAKEIKGVTFDELAFALKEVVDLGVKGEDKIFALARSSSMAAKGMKLAQQSVAALGQEMTGSLGVSNESFEAVIASIGQMSDAKSGLEVTAEELFSDMNRDVTTLSTSLRQMSGKDSKQLLESFNTMGAGLHNAFFSVEGVSGIREVMAKAFEGGEDNVLAINRAYLLTGLAQDELKKKILSGDIAGLFEHIGEQVKGMDTATLKTFSNNVGIASSDLGRFTENADALNKGFEVAQDRIVATGKGLGVMTARVERTRTSFQGLQEDFTDGAAAETRFGINGVEVLDFLKEFNVTSLLSIAVLGKPFLHGIGTAGGKLLEFGRFASTTNVSMAGAMGLAKGMGTKFVGAAKGIAAAIGPIGAIALGVGVLTTAAVAWYASSVEKELAETEAEQGRIHRDPNRVIKNIERVQKQVDLDKAAGKAANPAALRELERYNEQLDVMQGKTAQLQEHPVEAIGIPSVSDLASNMPAPLTPEQIASMTSSVNMSTGATEQKLDRNNELLEQLISVTRQRLAQGQGNIPAVQGRASGSGLGQSIAGGDI